MDVTIRPARMQSSLVDAEVISSALLRNNRTAQLQLQLLGSSKLKRDSWCKSAPTICKSSECIV